MEYIIGFLIGVLSCVIVILVINIYIAMEFWRGS
jgi:hypothetical protein